TRARRAAHERAGAGDWPRRAHDDGGPGRWVAARVGGEPARCLAALRNVGDEPDGARGGCGDHVGGRGARVARSCVARGRGRSIDGVEGRMRNIERWMMGALTCIAGASSSFAQSPAERDRALHDPASAFWREHAPATYRAKFETTKGVFV